MTDAAAEPEKDEPHDAERPRLIRQGLSTVGVTGLEPATFRPPDGRATKLRHTPATGHDSLSDDDCDRDGGGVGSGGVDGYDELRAAVAASRSWRGLLRTLGLAENNGHAARTVRSRCQELGIDYSHFGWSRGRSDATTRVEALDAPALTLPASGFAARHLRASGSLLVAAALALDGRRVSWPLEPAAYDLVIDDATGLRRVQVKTTTQRAGRSWLCHITRSRYDPGSSGMHRRLPYDPRDIDDLAIVDGDLVVYVVPYAEVAALVTVTVSTVAQYAVRRFAAT